MASIVDVLGSGTRSGRSLIFATPGIYVLEAVLDGGDYAPVNLYVWGAGGGGTSAAASNYGGPGGHGRGVWCWRAGQRLCVVVGSGGLSRAGGAGPGPAGFGGGGLTGSTGHAGQGGGLTGFFEGLRPEIGLPILIAGGGGGSGAVSSRHGGPGGGTTGGDGTDTGSGATQSAPGSPPTHGLSGAFRGGYLLGWSPGTNTDGGGGGGGGGGLYGGGSGADNTNDGGGGGGSGFRHPDLAAAALEAGSGTGSGATPGGSTHPLFPGSSVGYGGVNTTDGKPGYAVIEW